MESSFVLWPEIHCDVQFSDEFPELHELRCANRCFPTGSFGKKNGISDSFGCIDTSEEATICSSNTYRNRESLFPEEFEQVKLRISEQKPEVLRLPYEDKAHAVGAMRYLAELFKV